MTTRATNIHCARVYLAQSRHFTRGHRGFSGPLTQPAAIMRWFVRRGFVVTEKPNGMPIISRAHFEARLSGGTAAATTPQQTASNTPDISGFLSRYDKGVGYGQRGKKTHKQ